MIRTDRVVEMVTVSKGNATYRSATRTITAEASDVGLRAVSGFPLLLDVQSATTGAVRRFVRGRYEMETGYGEERVLVAVTYHDRRSGLTLRLIND